MENIEKNEVMQQVLKDSFGGVMYNVANRDKYQADELIKQWDELEPIERESANGLIKGAMNFLQGN